MEDINLLSIDFQYINVICLSILQNKINVIRSLNLENKSSNKFQNLNLQIKSDIPFAEPFNIKISNIDEGQIIEIPTQININQQYILQLSEKIEGNLSIIISSESETLVEKLFPITILPADYWPGSSFLPELTACYVTPNVIQVKQIISKASKILQNFSSDARFTGYDSRNINHVRLIVASIYEALKELNISYQLPDKSFTEIGQRIRFADDVVNIGSGTCIDTALLFASCLEAANLYPLIILINGHAFVGVHLVPETFQDTVCDDITELTKRLGRGLSTIAVIESTMIDDNSKFDFESACLVAEQNLVSIADFQCFIDIERCRFSGIMPLPRLNKIDGVYSIDIEDNTDKTNYQKPQELSIYDIPSINSDNSPITKQTIWERKLLDLSLRNSLLNLRFSRKTLLLLSSGINKIEDILASGEEFKILPRPKDLPGCDEDFDGGNITIMPGSTLENFIIREIESKRLHSFYSETENANALKFIYRNSKSSMEENGANTLYLAIGLLRWYETSTSETPRYAPILLLPIEIIRRSVTSGYIIRSREEDVVPNITLSEMLRQNFGLNLGLPDPLPTDESGVDVPKILAIVRNSILNMKRWDVEEKAVIGNFSFNKFVMWNDIHSHADLLKNSKIVNSLIDGKLTFEQDFNSLSAQDMDKKYSPSEILLPVSADSSQLEAIQEATSGKSFILFGPPGTGKSQTITNIIANALYNGKRVLFVAQKAAALEVVRTRLDKLGLSPFCLDVFSNKANKTDVLKQLNNSIEVSRYKEPADFKLDAQKLFELRKELNGFMESLHKKTNCGLSLYETMSVYLSMDENIEPKVQFPYGLVGTISKELKELWFDIANEASVICSSCGNPADNKLNKLNFSNFSQNLEHDLDVECTESLEALQKLNKSLETCNEWLKVSNYQAIENIDNYKQFIYLINSLNYMNFQIASFNDTENFKDQYFLALKYGKDASITRKNIIKKYNENILSKNWNSELETWKQSENKFFISKFFIRRKIKSSLKQYIIGINTPQPQEDISQIIQYQEELSKSEKFAEINEITRQIDKTETDNWDKVLNALKKEYEIDDIIKKLSANPFEYQNIKKNFAQLFAQGYKTYLDFYGEKFLEASTNINCVEITSQKLFEIGGLDPNALNENISTESTIEKRISLLTNIKNNLNGLRDWYLYLENKRKAENNSMSFAYDFFDNTDISPNKWLEIFQKSFYKALADYVFSADENAKLFKGDIFDDKIKRYRELNNKYTELAKAELFAIMASRTPNLSTESSKNSEPGILMKNIRSNGRGTSIRKIFDQIPNLLPRLCPCMLMSPMSVAQYLTLTDKPQFDITIFDEASQMPTSDAVGAIARSENVIITGDPKQMPPTSFFNSTSTDEDNIEIEDLESILDDSLALNINSKNLLWHYRSKHETLITFSNSEYYNNSLLTFPSTDNRISKVTFEKIEGFYDKGKTRRNLAEAQAIINEIDKRLSDPDLSKLSIGVVTFSIVQQQLIDDLLSNLFATKPELEKIAMNSQEPLFIKNLESVQGDERDVILFSVGYGPDKDGKVSMNFGPLNQKGGERRLNVAVSRARCEMKIFSTLTSDMINLNKTSSKGVEGLKKFLAFAQNGISSIKFNSDINNKNIIAEQIQHELMRRGFESDIMIGSSNFKIDVAICHPDDKDKYLIALLLDSNESSRIKTARDREIIQPSILNSLGWNVLKIWSIEWFNNKENVINNIISKINEFKNSKTIIKEKENPIIIKLEQISKNEQDNYRSNTNIIKKQPYFDAVLSNCGNGTNELALDSNSELIRNQLLQIINTEAPITLAYLYKKIARAWGIARVSQSTADILGSIAEKMNLIYTSYNGCITCWSSDVNINNFNFFRVDEIRDATEIPIYEYANAIKYVLENQIALPIEDLKRETAKELGFSRSGAQIESAIQNALTMLSEKFEIAISDNKIVLQ